jgi:hypothetical protein
MLEFDPEIVVTNLRKIWNYRLEAFKEDENKSFVLERGCAAGGKQYFIYIYFIHRKLKKKSFATCQKK